MRCNFDAALAAVLVHEGGFVHDRLDPGGATNKGVTQKVYNLWRIDHQLPARSVKYITPAEICALYKRNYWDALKGDELPSGLDYCLFDFAVNSGVNRAASYLQEALMVDVDGKLGPISLAAAKEADAAQIIDTVCDMRQQFLMGLRTFARFGKGWTARVKEVRAKAKAMAA